MPRNVRTIAEVKMDPASPSKWGPEPEVHVRLNDGTEFMIFRVYPDEEIPPPKDLVGLTVRQARRLKQDVNDPRLAAS